MDTSDSTTANTTANPSKEEPTAAVKKEGENKMEVEGKGEEKGGGGNKKVTLPAPAVAAGNTASGGGGEKKKSDEPDFQMIANPARVLPQQVR